MIILYPLSRVLSVIDCAMVGYGWTFSMMYLFGLLWLLWLPSNIYIFST